MAASFYSRWPVFLGAKHDSVFLAWGMMNSHVRVSVFIVTVCLIAVSAATIATLLEARGLIRDSRTDVNKISSDLSAIAVTSEAAATQMKEASVQANLASQEQRKYWNKTSLETYKTMADLRLTIVRTDRSLNDVFVPQLTRSVGELSRSVGDTEKLIADMHQELQPSLLNLARASSAAADTMSNPSIKESLAHVDATSAQLEKGSEQLALTAGNIEQATDAINQKIHQALKPASLGQRIFERILGIAGPAAQVAVAVK